MSSEQDTRVEAALGDYLRRLDEGEAVDRQAFLASYPDLAPALESCLEVALLVEHMAGRSVAEARNAAGSHDTSVYGETRGTAPPAITSEQTIDAQSGIPASVIDASQLPRNFGRFEIQKELGQGGMGAVYLAFDTRLQRPVALKFPKFSKDEDPGLLERFYREARSAATLRHPNICPVYDADCIDGVHFIAMAYIEGRPLAAYLDRKSPPNPRTAALTVRKIARAVHEAHKHGVVHRDLKPSNIVIDDRNEPIVMDFGLARIAGHQPQQQERNPSRATAPDLDATQQGAIVGTPRYMSPEQARGAVNKVGPASDIFSLGIVFYELLTGHPPFQAQSLNVLLARVIADEPTAPSQVRAGIDPALESICLKMLAKRPEDRYGSMQEVADALTEALKVSPASATAEAAIATQPAASATKDKPRIRGRTKVALLTAALLAVIAAAIVVIRVKTADGTLVVELDQADAEVKVLNEEGAVEIIRRSDGDKLRLSVAPGKHQLLIEKDGFQVFADDFEIGAGGAQVIRARLEPIEVARSDVAAPVAPTKPATKSASPKETQYDLARWLFAGGANVEVVLDDGSRKLIKRGDSVPPSTALLKAVHWEFKGAQPNFDSEDRARLASCTGVESIWLRDQVLVSTEWLSAFPNLTHLGIVRASSSDAALQSLGRLKRLRRLYVESGIDGATPAAWRFLRDLSNLEEVNFNAAPLTDQGMTHLAGLNNLRTIMIWAAGVTDAGLTNLRGLPHLEYLSFGESGHGITASGLAAIGEAPQLTTLRLIAMPIDDEGLAKISQLPWFNRLTALNLWGTQVTSQGIAAFASLENLETLVLDRTQVDDDAIRYLTQHKKLKLLELRETRIRPRAFAALREALPDCKIEYDPHLPLHWRMRYYPWPNAGPMQPPEDWTSVVAAAPLVDRDRQTLQFNWGNEAPAPNVPFNHFAIVATTEFETGEGDYTLEVASDDGVRVFLDDKPILEHWTWRLTTTDTVALALTSGRHRLRVEYFEIDGLASLNVKLRYAPPPMPEGFGAQFVVEAGSGAKDLYLYDLKTKEWKNLTDNPADDINPAWSFDGAKIAFMSNRNGAYRLFTMDHDGANVTQLTAQDCIAGSGPAWSPSGDRIAVFDPHSQPVESWIVAADGTNRTSLSNQKIWDLTWSPDGERLAFAVRKDKGFRIGTIRADGEDFRELPTHDNPYGYVDPHWSPDSRRLTFVSWVNGLHVCVINADGSDLRVLTTEGHCYGPTFSRDGHRILYQQSSGDETGRIFVMDATGGNRQEFAWPSGLNAISRAPFLWRPGDSPRQ